jgi:hypothetical protein
VTCEDLGTLTNDGRGVLLRCKTCGWSERLDHDATLSDVVIAETRHVGSENKRKPKEAS